MEINCGKINEKNDGDEVTVYGWCRYIRDHGGKLFIDLADRYGITQLVFEKEIKKEADELGKEYVIKVNGKVRKRSRETIDTKNPTGMVEINVDAFELVNKSKLIPFEITEERENLLPSEDIRFKYRYIDLRRKRMIKTIEFRDKATKTIRKFFWDNDFLELETPYLVRDTYDASGSRTFLVPSRVNKGKFYSLPQSPQIYKQLCMIGGLDKYFQIARVFRDEDPREDRQPEFTQVDLEVSFKDENYIQDLIERLFKRLFKEVLGKDLKIPFAHMDYKDSMNDYGNDKPDLRFSNKLIDITTEAKLSNYDIIKRIASNGGNVRAVVFDVDFTSKECTIKKNYMLELIDLAKRLGLKGLTWMFMHNDALESEPITIAETMKPIEKPLLKKLGAKEGNIIVIGADMSEPILLSALSKLRRIFDKKIGKFDTETAFLWVDNFPLFEKDEITGALQPSHNPFVSPNAETEKLLYSEPEKVIGRKYDLVLNGIEIGGGAIRIKNSDMQRKIFEIIGVPKEDIDRSMGFLIEALSYGAPIHGGLALGLDRVISVLMGDDDIKDFILFPKNRRGQSPLDSSPSSINSGRLKDDFNIKLEKDVKID